MKGVIIVDSVYRLHYNTMFILYIYQECPGSRSVNECLCIVINYTGPLQYRSLPGRDTTCQGKGKFGKLGGEKTCIVVYGSARSSECEAHGPSATATI